MTKNKLTEEEIIINKCNQICSFLDKPKINMVERGNIENVLSDIFNTGYQKAHEDVLKIIEELSYKECDDFVEELKKQIQNKYKEEKCKNQK